LIHMNGRMYDFQLGRFLGVDPFIQAPTNSQSLNPYSYIMNNPLSGTDPTGYAICNDVDHAVGGCSIALQSPREQLKQDVNDGMYDANSNMLGKANVARAILFQDEIRNGRQLQGTLAPSSSKDFGFSVGENNKNQLYDGSARGIFKRHRTPKSQEDLIRSVGGDLETLKYVQDTHQDFVNTLISIATMGGVFGSGGNVAKNAFATGDDAAVFWSGLGEKGGEKAIAWIRKNGGATLESTMRTKGIKIPKWDSDNPTVVAAWREASADFAAGARGHIRVLQGNELKLNPVWKLEFSMLTKNPNVMSIRSINPETGAEVLLWTK